MGLRVDLAACYRLVAPSAGKTWSSRASPCACPAPWTSSSSTPRGVLDEITASSLVKIDLEGNTLDDSPFPVNPAGFVIHSAIHDARAGRRCVLHTHSLNGVAVSAQHGGLLPSRSSRSSCSARLGYHDFEGVGARATTRSRAWWPTSATRRTSSCATTGSYGGEDGRRRVRGHVLPGDVVRDPGARRPAAAS